MKFERLHITTFLALAIVAWSVLLLVRGVDLSFAHLAPFGTVVGVLAGVGVLFDKFAWRWERLHSWFVKRPDLRGTWRVELQSSYIMPVECPKEGCDEKLPKGDGVPLIVCYMGVEQTLSELKMHLMTPQSESHSISAVINPSPTGSGYQVVVVYTNSPDVHQRTARTSETHRGSFVAQTHGPGHKPTSITAEYWTDRKTVGSMDFLERVDEVFTRFADAQRHFDEGGGRNVSAATGSEGDGPVT